MSVVSNPAPLSDSFHPQQRGPVAPEDHFRQNDFVKEESRAVTGSTANNQSLTNNTCHISPDMDSSPETQLFLGGPREEESPVLDIFINNVVCTFSTRCYLNLKKIAMEGAHVEYRRENGASFCCFSVLSFVFCLIAFRSFSFTAFSLVYSEHSGLVQQQ